MDTNIENLLKTSLGEIEKVLNTKTVVGEPITFEGYTFVPLISVGFGFGGGGGGGKSKAADEGSGAGIGVGVGIKPVAIIIISKEGVRVERIKGGRIAEGLGTLINKAMEKVSEKKTETA